VCVCVCVCVCVIITFMYVSLMMVLSGSERGVDVCECGESILACAWLEEEKDTWGGGG
jgi:hypothetical protein